MPKQYKDIYKLNIINGKDVFDIENMVKVPIISSVTVSGFNTFVNYPKFTYNIDVQEIQDTNLCYQMVEKT